jgi:DNA polymerase-3 subunit delta
MKLTWKQIDPFLKSPDPKARVVLVYGPDNGLMRERAKTIAKTVVDDLDDPFNVVTLNTDILAEDPARLNDEAMAISMMGGARLIKIEQASDKLTTTIKDYLENPSPENLVIVEADALGTRSSLRQLCEKSKNAAALPCYVEDERGVANVIRETLSNAGYFINADAVQILAANVMGDRTRVRSELEKLMLYMGDEKNITAEHIFESTGNIAEANLDDLVYSVGGGNTKKAIESYNRLIGEGVADIAILRSLQNHFRRLHYTQSLMQSGKSIDQAVKSLTPPIFFKVEPAFKAQINKWQGPKLDMILQKLVELEAQTKRTGTPVQTLCSQAILSISAVR